MYASLGSSERADDRRSSLISNFGKKRVLLDESALLMGEIPRLKEQFRTRCIITSNQKQADIFLTTKSAAKRARENLKKREVIKKKTAEQKCTPIKTKRHNALMANSNKENTNIQPSMCEEFLEKRPKKVRYYEDWKRSIDEFWKSSKDDPLKKRFRHPITGIYVYVTDINGLYKIEPVQLSEMPFIPTGKDIPCELDDRRSCPFRLNISNTTKRKDRFKADQKKKQRRKDHKHEWCDCCRIRVPNFSKHERNANHKKRVKNTNWKDLDDKIFESNKEWIEAKKQTIEAIRQQQERGKIFKEHPVRHMGDLDSFILALEGKADPISAEAMEHRQKRRKISHSAVPNDAEKKKKEPRDALKGRSIQVSSPLPRTNHIHLVDTINSEQQDEEKNDTEPDSEDRFSNSGLDEVPHETTSPEYTSPLESGPLSESEFLESVHVQETTEDELGEDDSVIF